MKTKVRVWLNDICLDELDPRIIIHEVSETAPTTAWSAVDRGTGPGQRTTGYKRQYMDVSVVFAIAEKHDLSARTEVLDAVNGWMASGGILEVSYRDGRRLQVVPELYPARGSARDWTQDYTLTLRAYDVPMWEDLETTSLFNGKPANVTQLIVPGNADTPLGLTMTGAADTLLISVNGGTWQLTGLGMASNDTLTVTTENGILTATVTDGDDKTVRSVVTNLSDSSDDAMILHAGTNSVTVTCSNADASLTLRARGRWL